MMLEVLHVILHEERDRHGKVCEMRAREERETSTVCTPPSIRHHHFLHQRCVLAARRRRRLMCRAPTRHLVQTLATADERKPLPLWHLLLAEPVTKCWARPCWRRHQVRIRSVGQITENMMTTKSRVNTSVCACACVCCVIHSPHSVQVAVGKTDDVEFATLHLFSPLVACLAHDHEGSRRC